MKPNPLKFPYSWEERRPCIKESVFHIPEYYPSHHEFLFPEWNSETIFGNNQPVNVEFCAGNGAWIVDKAKKNPFINWVAVELRFDRVQKIWSRKESERLNNLFIIHGEAYTLSSHYLKASSVNEVFVNFPDPWPKKRHAKNRLLKEDFLKEVARIVHPEGRCTFVTDDTSYADATYQVVLNIPQLELLFPYPYYVPLLEGYGTSYFNQLWRDRGKVIRYAQFRVKK